MEGGSAFPPFLLLLNCSSSSEIPSFLSTDIPPQLRSKYELLLGDVTKPRMNLGEKDLALLRPKITHVVHLAASVSFEDPYEDMFRSNVTATQKVLEFAHELQVAAFLMSDVG